MKKSITKNYIYNLTYQILVLILPLITTPYISRVLGAENIGIYSYTISITTFFILFGSLGIALYGQREIAYVQNDKKKYSNTFWEIVILRAITMFISLVIFYFTFANGNNDYQLYYKILILEILANIIDISWFFQGLEEFKKTVVRNIIVKLISLICIFTLVKNRNDLPIYLGIYVLSTFLGNLSLWFYLPKYIKKINLNELKILRHLKPTISLFIPQIAIQVYTLLDKTMIGAIINDKTEVGYYEQAQKIIKILLTIEGTLGTVMMPRIAKSFAENDEEKIKLYIEKSFHMAYFLAFPLIFGVISVANAIVPLFFGEGYDKTVIIMQITSAIILFIGISGTIGHQYLLPTKKQKEYTISVICGALMNIIMNALLIFKLGAIGAAIGTIIAELTVALVQIMFVRKELDIKKILGISKKYILASVIMFIICKIISGLIRRNIISVMVQVIVGAIIYFVVLVVLKDEFIKELFDKIINFIKKGRKTDNEGNHKKDFD